MKLNNLMSDTWHNVADINHRRGLLYYSVRNRLVVNVCSFF